MNYRNHRSMKTHTEVFTVVLESRVSQCSPDWLVTLDINQAGLELSDICLPRPPKCLGLKACATTTKCGLGNLKKF